MAWERLENARCAHGFFTAFTQWAQDRLDFAQTYFPSILSGIHAGCRLTGSLDSLTYSTCSSGL